MLHKTLMSAAAAVALLGGAALAQTSPPVAAPERAPTVVPPTTTPAPSTTVPAMRDDAGFRSYRSLEKGTFSGTIVGGMSADELIGKEIVDQNGSEIAEVSDLIVEADNTVKRVLVDVGGFLGIGERTVALDIGLLQQSQGDEDELVTSMTKEQIEALPALQKRDKSWYVRG